MYHHTFLFVIISDNKQIEECLKGIDALEDCDYSFQTVSCVEDAKKFAEADVAYIFDAVSGEESLAGGIPVWSMLEDIRVKESANGSSRMQESLVRNLGMCGGAGGTDICEKSVLVAEAGSSLLADAKIVSQFSAVWVMPGAEKYDAVLLREYFRHLARRMKESADARKQAICFETLIDSAPDICWFKDTEGAHLMVNQGFCDMVGKTKEQIYKKGHCYIWDASKEDEEVCLKSDKIIMEGRITQTFEETVKTDEDIYALKSYKSALIDVNGEIFGTCGVAKDETALQNMSSEMEMVLDSIPFAMLVEDRFGIVRHKNRHFDEYFPEFSDIVGENSEEWKRSLSRRIILEDMLKEVVVVPSDKEQKILVFEEESIQDATKQVIGMLITLMDITLERSIAEKNAHTANTDYLTGLSNRRSLMQHLEKIHTSDDFTLLMIDLDNFKQVNDTFGHEAGDKALIETARVMKECFQGEFIARLGGDEFMIVESGKTLEEVKRDAAHLQDMFRESFDRHQEFRCITASIGIFTADTLAEEDRHVSNLMNEVDKLLYQAKRSGKNRYCVYGEN